MFSVASSCQRNLTKRYPKNMLRSSPTGNCWDRNITITTRLVDTVSTPMLLNVVRLHKIDPKLLITHRFKLDRILDAYETFAHAADTRALKVIIEA
jgi:alcohol dehydrogenase